MRREKKGYTVHSDPLLLQNREMVATFTQAGMSRKRADFGKEKLNGKTGRSLPTIRCQVSLKCLEGSENIASVNSNWVI